MEVAQDVCPRRRANLHMHATVALLLSPKHPSMETKLALSFEPRNHTSRDDSTRSRLKMIFNRSHF